MAKPKNTAEQADAQPSLVMDDTAAAAAVADQSLADAAGGEALVAGENPAQAPAADANTADAQTLAQAADDQSANAQQTAQAQTAAGDGETNDGETRDGEQANSGEPVVCRLLLDFDIDGASYHCNSVVRFAADQAAQLAERGIVDTDQGAIDYCINELGAVVFDHQPVAAAE